MRLYLRLRLRIDSGKTFDQGSNVSNALELLVSILGNCSNRCSRYKNGFRSFSFAVSTMLYVTALALAPRGVFENRKFLRPITKGLIDRSLRLLSISKCPFSKNAVSLFH